MNKANIAKKIKELRRVLGLTQEQLAAKIGVTFSTINRWENEHRKPSPLAMKVIETLQELSEREQEITSQQRN